MSQASAGHGSKNGIEASKHPASANSMNKKVTGMYNTAAIPYDQRPTPKKSQSLTPKQQYRLFVESIKQEGIDGMSPRTRLQVEYRKLIRTGLDHATAEAQARRSLNLPRNQKEFMEFQTYHASNGVKRNKDGIIIGNKAPGSKSTPGGDPSANTNGEGATDASGASSSGLPGTPGVHSKKKGQGAVVPIRPTITFEDVGGINKMAHDLRRIFQYPLRCPEIFAHLKINPTRGILLHGPPGCGKTLVAHAIAGEFNLPLIKLNATEVVSKLSGESENKIRQMFSDAVMQAPCIIFIDNLDAIAGKKEDADRDMSKRIVSQLMASIDSLNTTAGSQSPLLPPPPSAATSAIVSTVAAAAEAAMPTMDGGDVTPDSGDSSGTADSTSGNTLPLSESEQALVLNENHDYIPSAMLDANSVEKVRRHVFVIGATTKIDYIDPGLRRAGRFDKEIALDIPDESVRTEILSILTRDMTLSSNCDLEELGRKSVGFVGADLVTLVNDAGMHAIDRVFDDSQLWQRIMQLAVKRPRRTTTTTSTTMTDQTGVVPPSVASVDLDDDRMNDIGDGMGDDGPTTDRIGDKKNSHQDDDGNDNDDDDSDGDGDDSDCIELDGDDSEDLQWGSTAQSPQGNTTEQMAEEKTEDGIDAPLDQEALIQRIQDMRLTNEQLALISVEQNDFLSAMQKIEATAMREGFAVVPTTTWDDVGGLDDLREELFMQIVHPIRHPELYKRFKLKVGSGVLLFGPPGCGKTLIAQAVANASSASFMSVKGPELLNQYVGESERAVRQIFSRARACAPCVIFFDEIDSIAPHRGGSGNQASERVVAQLLVELDGVGGRGGVFVIAATNRPDTIDKALLRPGRLGTLLYTPMPDAKGRYSILSKHTRELPLDASSFPGDTDQEKTDAMLWSIANNPHADGYSGADISALVNTAVRTVFTESMMSSESGSEEDVILKMRHFDIAFTKVRASLDPKSRQYYEKLRQQVTQGKTITVSGINTIQDGSQSGSSGR